MCYNLSCDDKARPIKIDIDYTVHFYNSFSEYIEFLKSEDISKDIDLAVVF